MPTVKFTRALKRFYPDLQDIDLDVDSLIAVLNDLDGRFPGIKDYVVDEQDRLRKHVNIFIDGSLIKDRDGLTDMFQADSEIYIMQALSGG